MTTTRPIKVPKSSRSQFLPDFFGLSLMIQGENLICSWMEALSTDYNGGSWVFYKLSNNGYFMAPDTRQNFKISCPSNYFEGEMSASAAGIVATLFAINQLLSSKLSPRSTEHLTHCYHQLLAFAKQHEEASQILFAID